jgi:site-specific DNA-methyltransferase (adenine-specific)
MSTPWNVEQLYSSSSNEWGTPDYIFNALDDEFNFELDAAASEDLAKCEPYFTKSDNALLKDWSAVANTVWLNPPYGRGIGKWIEKAYKEAQKGCTVVVLTFVRSDTRWWHDWALKAEEIRMIKGRVAFTNSSGVSSNAAPAPSCVLIFDKNLRRPVIKAWHPDKEKYNE